MSDLKWRNKRFGLKQTEGGTRSFMKYNNMTGIDLTMRLFAITLLIAGLVLWSGATAHADGIVPGHVLVRLNNDNDLGDIEDDYGADDEDYVANTGLHSLSTPTGSTETEFVRQLNQDSRVAWAETDTYLISPEVGGEQFHFAFDAGPNPGCYYNQHAFVEVNLGRSQRLANGKGVVVAILDTGATFDHPALQRRYLKGYNVIQPDQPANDIPDGLLNNAVGHGTMIAGIIAHIAPGTKLMPIRVLNGDGYGTMLDVVKGIDYAVRHGATVLNMSFGTSQRSQALDEALNEIDDAGALVVASAGNNDDSSPHFPAASDDVLAVASVEADYKKSSYSNYGEYVSVVAPGTGIRSTYYTGGYATWSGTSFSTPFITAEAALLLSKKPTLSASHLQDLISNTARAVDRFNPQYEELLGNGIIDIEAALKNVP
jgi:subtilisin family serine protease